MRFARSLAALSAAVLALPVLASAAKPTLAGKSYVVNLTREAQAAGQDTIVFTEKTVDSRVAGGLALGAAKYKAKVGGDDVTAVSGKIKCDQGKGELSASVKGNSIAGKVVCKGKDKTTTTTEFTGQEVGAAAPAAPQSSTSPTVPGSETGTGAAAPGNPAPAAPAGAATPAAPAPAAPATTAPAVKAPGAH